MDRTTGATLVQASLRAQAELGAGAYLLPGWLPTTPDEDLRPAYEQIVATASQLADLPPKPFVLFVGGHTRGLDQVVRLLEDLPHFLSGIYLQMTPFGPMKDGPSKLEALTSLYQHAASLGFQVIAGHAGAVTPVLRALDIDAADAGLAIGEGFDQSTTKRRAKPETEAGQKRRGRRSRMYFGQIGRSLEAVDVERLLGVPEGPGGSTAAKCYRLLRSILATVVEDGLIAAHPCTIKGAGIEPADERPIHTVTEAHQLAEAIHPRMRCAVLLAAFVGLRKGELLGLRRGDVDLAGHEITIAQQRQPTATALTSSVRPGPTPGCAPTSPAPSLVASSSTDAGTKEFMYRLGHASHQAALRYQHATRQRDRAIANAIEGLVRQRPHEIAR